MANQAIGVAITNINSQLITMGGTLTTLSGNTHTHANKSILDGITNTGPSSSYLGED